MAKKVLLTLVVIFLVFYLISDPRGAASAVGTVFDAIGGAFRSLVTFFQSLAG